MKIKVVKTWVEGRNDFNLEIDGKKVSRNYYVSRMLTGTTNEFSGGIFDIEVGNFYYGDYKSPEFKFEHLDPKQDADAILSVLMSRIKVVRNWVDSVKANIKTGTAEVEIFESREKVIHELDGQKRLYYRAANGQFTQLL